MSVTDDQMRQASSSASHVMKQSASSIVMENGHGLQPPPLNLRLSNDNNLMVDDEDDEFIMEPGFGARQSRGNVVGWNIRLRIN